MAEHFISRDDAEQDMLAAAAYLAENITSADGRAEAMKAIVPVYLEDGNVDLAAELANSIDEPFSRDRLLIQVAVKCAEADDDEYALQLADAIEDEGTRAQASERIALAKVNMGQIDKALDFAAEMLHPDFVLGGVAVKQFDAGEDAAARATLESIEFPAAEVAALLQVASGLSEKGETAKAAELVEQAAEAARDIEHDEEKIRALCDAGNAFIEAKRSDLAVTTFDEARAFTEELDNVHREGFLMNCALGFKVAGSEDLAESTLDLITDKTEMASALLAFSREDWRADRKEDAVEGLDEAFEILRSQREIETRDSRSRHTLITNVAVQFAAFGEMDKAIEVAEFNPDPREHMSSLTQIAQLQAMAGSTDAAAETLEMIEDDEHRLFGLISVSDAYERSGEHEKALELLEEAANFSNSVPQLASRSNALNELAQRFAAYGLEAHSREVSLENLDVIAEIKDESSQAAALVGLASVYRNAGFAAGDAELVKVGTLLYRIG